MTKSKQLPNNVSEQPEQPIYHPDVKIKTPFNKHLFPNYHEANVLPSVTIPDQTMPLKTLLERYARGLPLGGFKQPIYNGDDQLPDLRKLDLSEIYDLRQRVSSDIAEKQAELIRLDNENKQKFADEQLNALVDKKLAEREKQSRKSDPEK